MADLQDKTDLGKALRAAADSFRGMGDACQLVLMLDGSHFIGIDKRFIVESVINGNPRM